MKRRHLLLITLSIALPAALFFIMPTGLARLLLWPGYRVTTVLRIDSDDFVHMAMQVAVGWVLCAVVTALLIVLVKRILWPRKTLFVICALVLIGVMFIEARAEGNREYEGTWERGFEESGFYYRGECWRPPYWLVPTPDIIDKLNEGKSGALHVRFVGDATALGWYGHLGQYVREIRVVRVIEARPAVPCHT